MNDELTFERTYNGVDWEQISESEAEDKLKNFYPDWPDMMEEMKKHKLELNTFGAIYRYDFQTKKGTQP